MRTLQLGILLTLMTASLGWAQKINPVVEARAVLATNAAHANLPVRMAVVAHVAPGYHINDHKPPLEYLIPTELKLDPNDQITVKNIVYPKGTPRKFAFSDVPLSVYEGTLVVGAVLQVGKAVPPGSYALKAKLGYQACNDHACLPPTSVPLTVTLKIVPRNVQLIPVEPNVFRGIQFE
jgi:DsbC/DsbD-like thiol-disulfide interchange protein